MITFGAVMGILCAWLAQGVAPLDAMRTAYVGNAMQSDVDFLNTLLNRGGIESMLGVIALILFALGLGADGARRRTADDQQRLFALGRQPRSSDAFHHVGGLFRQLLRRGGYVSLITASTITEKNYDKQGIDRRVLSRNAEAGGTITTPMVPWTDGGVFMAMTLGVSTLSYLPFLWYHMLVLLITLFYGYANIAIWRTGEAQEDDATLGVAAKS